MAQTEESLSEAEVSDRHTASGPEQVKEAVEPRDEKVHYHVPTTELEDDTEMPMMEVGQSTSLLLTPSFDDEESKCVKVNSRSLSQCWVVDGDYCYVIESDKLVKIRLTSPSGMSGSIEMTN